MFDLVKSCGLYSAWNMDWRAPVVVIPLDLLLGPDLVPTIVIKLSSGATAGTCFTSPFWNAALQWPLDSNRLSYLVGWMFDVIQSG